MKPGANVCSPASPAWPNLSLSSGSYTWKEPNAYKQSFFFHLINIKPINPAISQHVHAFKKIWKHSISPPTLPLFRTSINPGKEFPSWGTGMAAGLGYHHFWFIRRFQFIHSSNMPSSFLRQHSISSGSWLFRTEWRSVACHQYNICPSPTLPVFFFIHTKVPLRVSTTVVKRKFWPYV